MVTIETQLGLRQLMVEKGMLVPFSIDGLALGVRVLDLTQDELTAIVDGVLQFEMLSSPSTCSAAGLRALGWSSRMRAFLQVRSVTFTRFCLETRPESWSRKLARWHEANCIEARSKMLDGTF
jgi:hypothetical protein